MPGGGGGTVDQRHGSDGTVVTWSARGDVSNDDCLNTISVYSYQQMDLPELYR
jgi:hypothetical protein